MKILNWPSGYQLAGVAAAGVLALQLAIADIWLLALEVLGLLLLLLAYLVYCLFRTHGVMFRHSLFPAFIAAFLCLPLGLVTWQAQDALTQHRAVSLIHALSAYHRQQGAYPDSLDQLVPAYLPRVPRTALGLVWPRPYSYQPDSAAARSRGAFRLSYYQGALVDATYSSATSRWTYHD